MNTIEIVNNLASGVGAGAAAVVLGVLAVKFMLMDWMSVRLSESVKAEYGETLEKLRQANRHELERSRDSSASRLAKEKLEHDKNLIVFERKLDAAAQLTGIIETLLPDKQHPDMEWGEALEWLARDFETVKGRLDDFVCAYGAIVPTEVARSIATARVLCDDGKFEVEEGAADVSSRGSKMAENLYEALDAARVSLRRDVEQEAGLMSESTQ